MRGPRAFLIPILALGLACSAACSRTLMPTPALHLDPATNRFDGVPDGRRSNVVEILYATDRGRLNEGSEPARYGAERSPSLAFGSLRVRIGGPDLGWDELVDLSRSKQRRRAVSLRFLDATELVRLPDTPWFLYLREDPDITEDDVRRRYRAGFDEIHGVLRDRLGDATGRDVFLFVHGFNNTFEDAAMTMAEFWHFMGRPGVAIVYSWPGATAGIFGYKPDRESSEFTVSNLKRFIGAVAASEDVDRIHLIAHSRGADALGAAVRELHIHFSAQGVDTAERLKLENVVLIAPDVDQQVANQRFGSESTFDAARHLTMYTASGDSALGIASGMFKSEYRLGQIDPAVAAGSRVILDHLADRFTLVHQPRPTGFSAHSYHRTDPRVSSDLILLLGGHQRPDPGGARPLDRDPSGVWIVPRDYPPGSAAR